jgi:hypothetical protein
MKKWIIAVAALTLAANAAALAQSGRNKGSTTDSMRTDTMGGRPLPEAPIGHRQPRAGDVPDEKNLSSSSDPMTKEDAALDRKIKSICRGC